MSEIRFLQKKNDRLGSPGWCKVQCTWVQKPACCRARSSVSGGGWCHGWSLDRLMPTAFQNTEPASVLLRQGRTSHVAWENTFQKCRDEMVTGHFKLVATNIGYKTGSNLHQLTILAKAVAVFDLIIGFPFQIQPFWSRLIHANSSPKLVAVRYPPIVFVVSCQAQGAISCCTHRLPWTFLLRCLGVISLIFFARAAGFFRNSWHERSFKLWWEMVRTQKLSSNKVTFWGNLTFWIVLEGFEAPYLRWSQGSTCVMFVPTCSISQDASDATKFCQARFRFWPETCQANCSIPGQTAKGLTTGNRLEKLQNQPLCQGTLTLMPLKAIM